MQLLRMLLILIITQALGQTLFAAALNEPGRYSAESYGRVLRIYVNDRGLVNYAGLANDRELLDDFLADVGGLAPKIYRTWPDEDKIACLLNAYNAFTLSAIAGNYPIKTRLLTALIYPKNSIRQIAGVWDKLTFSLLSQPVTLNHLEHQILRTEFNEPRIHLALVCAARGCPVLRNEPYRGADLDTQLEDQVRRFLADPEKFKLDREGAKIHLSPIFKWYGEDFTAKYAVEGELAGVAPVERAVLNFIGGYLGGEDRKFISAGGFQVKYLDYDWSLNEQAE